MKVFLSWSGDRSKLLAEAMRDWLPRVIQAVQPWMSAADIEKGTMWRNEIARQLDEATVGIICLTSDNLDKPWLLFEAGAISKKLDDSFVCTYLLDLEPSEVREPLAQFQSTKAEKEDTKRLLQTINRALGPLSLQETVLDDVFEAMWPRLERRIQQIPLTQGGKQSLRNPAEIMEEILVLVRSYARQNVASEIKELKHEVLDLVIRKSPTKLLEDQQTKQKLLELQSKVLEIGVTQLSGFVVKSSNESAEMQ
jgi:TIR domain